jgi:hypothetical protein
MADEFSSTPDLISEEEELGRRDINYIRYALQND